MYIYVYTYTRNDYLYVYKNICNINIYMPEMTGN